MPVPPPPHATRAFQGIIHDIWQWDQELFDGSHATFECVVRPDTVDTLAFINPDTVLLTHEEHPGRDPFIDVPGGRVEPGEPAEEAARRELLEETGYRADDLHLFRTTAFKGVVRFEKTVFLAKNLTAMSAANPDAGERIRVQHLSWNELVALALNGSLRSPEAMLAILAMEFDPRARAVKETFLAS